MTETDGWGALFTAKGTITPSIRKYWKNDHSLFDKQNRILAFILSAAVFARFAAPGGGFIQRDVTGVFHIAATGVMVVLAAGAGNPHHFPLGSFIHRFLFVGVNGLRRGGWFGRRLRRRRRGGSRFLYIQCTKPSRRPSMAIWFSSSPE